MAKAHSGLGPGSRRSPGKGEAANLVPRRNDGRTPPAADEPSREPWSQRDANIVHGIDLGWRAVIGVVAGLLGILFIALAISGIHGFAAKGRLPQGLQMPAVVATVVLGAMFVAFAAGQAMQLSWVAGDEAFDERLWVRLGSAERGLWRLRDRGRAVWTFRIWAALSLTLLLHLDARLWRLLRHAALEGRWEEAGTAVGATIVMGYLAYRGACASYVPPQAGAGAAVSQGRWVVKAAWSTRAGAFFILVLGLSFLGWGVSSWFMRPSDRFDAWFYAAGGLVFLYGGAAELRVALRYRRFARPRIEIVRKLDRPLVLVCTVTLPVSPADARRHNWRASFEARWARFGTRRDSFLWLEARAPVSFAPHTSTASFTLRIDIPQTVPYPQSLWAIRVHSDEPRSQPIEFLLPQDLVFTEDYPAG